MNIDGPFLGIVGFENTDAINPDLQSWRLQMVSLKGSNEQ